MLKMDIHHGDCLTIIKTLPVDSIDLVICDLPYGCTQNTWDVKINLDIFFSEIERVAKKEAAVVFFHRKIEDAKSRT